MATSDEGESPPTEAPIVVEDGAHFADLVSGRDLLVVDFYADWCAPCVVVGDFLETVAAETPAIVAKVDVEVHEGLAADYNVRSLPTVVVFDNGEPVQRLVGLQDEANVREVVERYAD